MNLKINKAILRIWRKSFRNSPWLNEEFANMVNVTEFDAHIQYYMLYNNWESIQGVNIMFFSETRALE